MSRPGTCIRRIGVSQIATEALNKMSMPAAKISLSDHLRKIPRTMRPTVEAAIRTVTEAAPQAEEITYRSRQPSSSRAMWKLVRYTAGGANVVGIGTFPSHATMFFYRGRELDDGSGLLRGSGKDSRFITLNTPAEAGQPAVKRLVRQAFALGGTAAISLR